MYSSSVVIRTQVAYLFLVSSAVDRGHGDGFLLLYHLSVVIPFLRVIYGFSIQWLSLVVLYCLAVKL
jgi:hypothetical protein